MLLLRNSMLVFISLYLSPSLSACAYLCSVHAMPLWLQLLFYCFLFSRASIRFRVKCQSNELCSNNITIMWWWWWWFSHNVIHSWLIQCWIYLCIYMHCICYDVSIILMKCSLKNWCATISIFSFLTKNILIEWKKRTEKEYFYFRR